MICSAAWPPTVDDSTSTACGSTRRGAGSGSRTTARRTDRTRAAIARNGPNGSSVRAVSDGSRRRRRRRCSARARARLRRARSERRRSRSPSRAPSRRTATTTTPCQPSSAPTTREQLAVAEAEALALREPVVDLADQPRHAVADRGADQAVVPGRARAGARPSAVEQRRSTGT